MPVLSLDLKRSFMLLSFLWDTATTMRTHSGYAGERYFKSMEQKWTIPGKIILDEPATDTWQLTTDMCVSLLSQDSHPVKPSPNY